MGAPLRGQLFKAGCKGLAWAPTTPPNAGAAPQYAAMFVSAGEPGNAKKVQVSVAAARKVFRVFGVRFVPTEANGGGAYMT